MSPQGECLPCLQGVPQLGFLSSPVDARWAWQPSYSPRALEVSSEDAG